MSTTKAWGWRLAALAMLGAASTRGEEPAASNAPDAPIRVGIIGLDTSHATAFTTLLNDAADAQHVPGGRVVAAYPPGSRDIASSASAE